VHLLATRPAWRAGDWFSKRLTGWAHLAWFGRSRDFQHAETVLCALRKELCRRPPDHVVFSGDATALGFPEEVGRAAELLGVTGAETFPGLAVPGNHDYYTTGVASSGLFERTFAPWLKGERVDDAIYPFAQRVGLLWLIGLNSCTGNIWPWDASGRVDRAQLDRLTILLERLGPGLRVLVTHYPIWLARGVPEKRHHGLRDLADVVAVAVRGGVGLWLHGHRHRPYHFARTDLAPFPVICAGSATQEGVWSHGEYTITGDQLHAVRRVYEPVSDSFTAAEVFDLQLTGH
jgi:3',5'-cyclic AMP phosphodiesterase CpdA